MKRLIALISSIFICTSLMGCANNASGKNNNISLKTFDEAKAISMVVKDHLDFPSSPSDTVTKKLPTGGPSGTTANVKFTTKIQSSGKDTYLVTLTKDWGFSFNDEYVKSYWEYKVMPKSVALIESMDKDYLTDMMK